MTEIREAFPEIDDMDVQQLQLLQSQLLRDANGDWKSLGDEELTKLWKITRALRRRAGHTARKKTNGTGGGRKKKAPTTLDDLA